MAGTIDKQLNRIRAAYLAPNSYVELLKKEIPGIIDTAGNLVLSSRKAIEPVWCHNVWLNPQIVEFDSISEAAKKLKSLGRNWVMYPNREVRRGTLIAEQLPHLSLKPLRFPESPPKSPLGAFTLLNRNLIIASPLCSSPFPNGEVNFIESKTEPPSRAYLKLWEVFTLLGVKPGPKDRCLDAGACPGGWSWVLHSLKAKVLAIDRASLDPRIASLKGIEFMKGDALSLGPGDLGEFDWVFSDIICYPEQLYKWALKWVNSGKTKNIICTIKFQGNEHYDSVELFKKIPGSWLRHLSVNKHELTWAWLNK